MWKRIHQLKGSGQPASGADESVQDGNIFATSQSGAHAPPRPPRPDKDQLPPLPFEPAQTSPPANQNPLKRRVVSSTYSQPTPNLADGQFPRLNTQIESHVYPQDIEISPPSSPETDTTITRYVPNYQEHPASPDLSPVEKTTTAMQVERSRPESRPAASSIPVLRRDKRRNQVSEAAAKVHDESDVGYARDAENPVGNAEWDTFAAESRTSFTKGSPQAKPGFFNVSDNNALGITQVSGPSVAPRGHASFGDRIRKLKEGPLMQGSRPAWNGSSGRSNPVDPVSDQLHVKPLQITQKRSKEVNSLPNSGPNSQHEAGTRIVSPTTHGYAGPTIKSIAPSYSRRNNTDMTALPTSYNNPVSPTFGQRRPLPTNATIVTPTKMEKETSVSTIERNLHEALKDINIQTPHRNEPGSRFSVTTYASTTADYSPRMSSESPPPVPVNQPTISPILNRRHPRLGSSYDTPRATTRKAVGDPTFLGMSSASISSRRNSKALPKSPEEEQSVDLIGSLQAKLENLARQRANIQRSIFQMTQLMPHDTAGMGRGMEALRQQEEKRQVEALREDLADIMKEEHELGLKLHRAWKRKDEQAIYEPTTLWVRRVTG